jgi:predicted permease
MSLEFMIKPVSCLCLFRVSPYQTISLICNAYKGNEKTLAVQLLILLQTIGFIYHSTLCKVLLCSYKSPEDPDAIFSLICSKLLSTFESPIFSCSSSILSVAAEFVGFNNEAYITHGIQVCKENIKLTGSFFCLIKLGRSIETLY